MTMRAFLRASSTRFSVMERSSEDGACDDGAVGRRRPNGELSANLTGAVLHDSQSRAGACAIARRQTLTVVHDLQGNIVPAGLQAHANAPGASMLERVGDRFLRDPVRLRRRLI